MLYNFSKYDCAKISCEIFKKVVRLQLGRFPSLITCNFLNKMLTENEVLLQLGMSFQLGMLWYLDIKVKRSKHGSTFLI